jgi:hypothetical protein
MRIHRLRYITLPITRSVYAINPHNIYAANPTTDTRTVGSETSQVDVMLPTSRTGQQEAVGCP